MDDGDLTQYRELVYPPDLGTYVGLRAPVWKSNSGYVGDDVARSRGAS